MLKKIPTLIVGVCMLFNTIGPVGVHAINHPVSAGDLAETTVYLDSYGNIGLNSKFADWSYSEWAKPEDVEFNCLHFNQTGHDTPFVDVFFNSQVLIDKYVYQADIYPVSTQTSSFILGEITDNNKKYSYLATLDKDGYISVNGNQIKKIPYNEWFTVAVAVDTTTGTGDIYIDNKLEEEGIPLHNGGVYNPVYVRIGFDKASVKGHNEAYVNAVKLYSGNKIKIFDDSSKHKALLNGDYYYTGESDDLAKEILSDDAMFMTDTDSYFLKGEKKIYAEDKKPYFTIDNVLMLPAEYVADALDADITFGDNKISANGCEFEIGSSLSGEIKLDSAPALKGGMCYIPAVSFVEKVLGKYAYYDDRGFIVISNEERNYANSDEAAVNEEFSDIVYRFLQFERPSGDKLFDDIAKNSGGIYPRMFIKPDEIKDLKETAEKDEWFRGEKRRVINSCELHVNSPVEPFEFDYSEGQRLSASILSKLENNVFIPCLVMGTFIQNFTIDRISDMWKFLLISFIIGLIAIAFSIIVSKIVESDSYIQKIYTYGLSFSNFGFMGNAVVSSLFPNVFFEYLIFTLPLWILIYLWGVPRLLLVETGKKQSMKDSFKSFINPMFISMIIGIIIGVTKIKLPKSIYSIIEVSGSCMSPIAMILTGIIVSSISLKDAFTNYKIYIISLTRLLIIPLIFVIVSSFVHISETVYICAICSLAMPLGLNTIVIPSALGRDTTVAAGMTLVSHTLSCVTIPIVFSLFGY
ncbi:MAG: AEC family transporter [Clostridia bacterium]|nr:AEC family transporter [Clostridia bacterium]